MAKGIGRVLLALSALGLLAFGGAATASAAPSTSGADVNIGIQYISNGTQAENTAGVQIPGVGDPRAPFDVMLNSLNANGGLLGHKINPLWSTQNPLGAEPIPAQEQATCTYWTQDNHVFAAIILVHHTDTLLSCLQKAGVVVLTLPPTSGDDAQTFKKYADFAAGGILDMTRVAKVYVSSLASQGFFPTSTKVGIIEEKTPEILSTVKQVLLPALAQHKVKVADVAQVDEIDNVSSAQAAGPEEQAAVLKFRNDGVNRVLFMEHGAGVVSFTFMAAAQAQGYHPLYGLTSNDAPATVAIQKTIAPQVVGAKGVGWSPTVDTTTPAANATAQTCNALMQAGGVQVAPGNWSVCDLFSVLTKAAKAGGQLTASKFMKGLSSLGSVPSGATLGLKYTPTQHDGVSVVRNFAYSTGCTCFQYTSKPYPAG